MVWYIVVIRQENMTFFPHKKQVWLLIELQLFLPNN